MKCVWRIRDSARARRNSNGPAQAKRRLERGTALSCHGALPGPPSLLSKRLYEFRDNLEEHEALFAQRELLRCIQSRRYSFTPVKLANAMAGLPAIGWRQLAKRMAGCECRVSYAPYEAFLMIQAGLRRRAAQRKPLLDCLRARITKTEKDWDLRQNWYYLRRAVEEVAKQKVHPQERPFRIAAEYQSRWQHASAADRILAEGERLA